MNDRLTSLRQIIRNPAEAVRWACVLEATAPKAGNVYPGRRFNDLCHADFVKAADLAADCLAPVDQPISERMLQAVKETVAATGTNVNLGMVLLLGPMVAADELLISQGGERDANNWLASIRATLDSLTVADGANVYAAIRLSGAGGLDSVDRLDVRRTEQPVDLIEAMRLAADRDRIARQYACGYEDLVHEIVPIVWKAITSSKDILGGLAAAHLEILCREPDSLIARKNGQSVALTVQRRAQKVDPQDPQSVRRFDDSLRSGSHKLNPGTTADLIAAALYLILRTPTL